MKTGMLPAPGYQLGLIYASLEDGGSLFRSGSHRLKVFRYASPFEAAFCTVFPLFNP